MAEQKAKKGKKTRKYGRNAKFCVRYRLEQRAEKSQWRRLAKHLANPRFRFDGCARSRYDQLSRLLGY